MPSASDPTNEQPAGDSTNKRRRMYSDLRERAERQRRRHQEFIERIVQQEKERRRRSFRRHPG
jgi:hypothetical protein